MYNMYKFETHIEHSDFPNFLDEIKENSSK